MSTTIPADTERSALDYGVRCQIVTVGEYLCDHGYELTVDELDAHRLRLDHLTTVLAGCEAGTLTGDPQMLANVVQKAADQFVCLSTGKPDPEPECIDRHSALVALAGRITEATA